MLHAGSRNADGIALLKRILPDCVSGHLPRDDDHRDGIHVRRGNAGDGIGHARTGSD